MKFQLPSALFIDANLSPFELTLAEGQAFAIVKEVNADHLLVEVDVDGVQVKTDLVEGAAVGDALIYTLEGEYVSLAKAPVSEEALSMEGQEPEAPAGAATKARKGAGVRAQGCANKNGKLEGASY